MSLTRGLGVRWALAVAVCLVVLGCDPAPPALTIINRSTASVVAGDSTLLVEPCSEATLAWQGGSWGNGKESAPARPAPSAAVVLQLPIPAAEYDRFGHRWVVVLGDRIVDDTGVRETAGGVDVYRRMLCEDRAAP